LLLLSLSVRYRFPTEKETYNRNLLHLKCNNHP
jgi:hypothetical protein